MHGRAPHDRTPSCDHEAEERRVTNRYVDEMSREELVEEIKSLIEAGVFAPHEAGDPTILPAPALRRRVKRLRLRMFVEKRTPESDDAPG